MITYLEFLEIFKPLKVNFPDVGDEKLQEDYERLNIYSPEILKKTVEYLLEHYRGRTYPVFAEIWTALENVCENHRVDLSPNDSGEQCPHCHDSGYVPVIKYAHYTNFKTGQPMAPARIDAVGFCGCLIGRKRRAVYDVIRKLGYSNPKVFIESKKAWEETN